MKKMEQKWGLTGTMDPIAGPMPFCRAPKRRAGAGRCGPNPPVTAGLGKTGHLVRFASPPGENRAGGRRLIRDGSAFPISLAEIVNFFK